MGIRWAAWTALLGEKTDTLRTRLMSGVQNHRIWDEDNRNRRGVVVSRTSSWRQRSVESHMACRGTAAEFLRYWVMLCYTVWSFMLRMNIQSTKYAITAQLLLSNHIHFPPSCHPQRIIDILLCISPQEIKMHLIVRNQFLLDPVIIVVGPVYCWKVS